MKTDDTASDSLAEAMEGFMAPGKAALDCFEAMPEAYRVEVMRLLVDAMKRLGGGALRDLGVRARVEAIADIFARNGHEYEVLT